MRIAAIEASYWANLDGVTDSEVGVQIGAIGAASNIAVALMTGVTPEEYQNQVDKRAKT